MKYFATIGDVERIVNVGDGIAGVDGEQFRAEIETVPGSDRRLLRVDGRTVVVGARKTDGMWVIELEGRTFLVRVEDERSRSIRELAGAVQPEPSARSLAAPMPGLIVGIEVTEGDEVEQGQGLVIMEAMKMENELTADSAGTVTAVHVEVGQAVNKDEILLTLE